MSYASPTGAPPRPSPTVRPQRQDSSLDPTIPDEAPPAYEAVSHDYTVQAGPQRMDFSGPPPMPDRMSSHNVPLQSPVQPSPTGGFAVPGVGMGYGPTAHQTNPFAGAPPPPTNAGAAGSGLWSPPPVPPRHPASPLSPTGYPGAAYASPTTAPPPPRQQPAAAGGSQSPSPAQDATPTEAPVPGHPLLRDGNLLVYPKGHYCSKCGNTGYKRNDPKNPCTSDWRKYGKPFNGALAHSYSVAIKPGQNGTTTAANNFQRPLPKQQAAAPSRPQQQQQQQYQQQYYGGHPQPMQQQNRPVIHQTYYGGRAPPPNALVLQPGDPRIGGKLCYRCGGSGQEMSLFLFDDGPCRK
ncbi:uncharacterized protein EHS24_004738 [Apiotrichum porosum]|uniref:Uncharacterized protein n=1 Tax=Apiotrichum porosum TaxID=105984 RepID=A0A427Y5Z2_9TREE|nr:uncharacterized protein EHS24_004738 [Apiotrichum porosum]RSH86482.1 hypothetical protein EHS24_004738 [Apiotrichum porosum]